MIDSSYLLLALIWGINNAVIKTALRNFLPLSFNGLCLGIASLLLYGFLKYQGRSFPKFGRDWRRIIGAGILGNTIYQALFIFGINHTLAGNTNLILATVPIFTGIFTSVAGHEKFGWRLWLGLAVSFLGVGVVVFSSTHSAHFGKNTLNGDLTILASAVVVAVYLVICTRLLGKYELFPTITAISCSGSFIFVLLSIPSFLSQDWHSITLWSWGALAYASIIGTAIAAILFYRLLKDKGGTRAALVDNLVPIVGLLAAWLIVGEKPTVFQAIGAGAIISATWLAHHHEQTAT